MKPVITRIDCLPRSQKKIRVAAYCRVSTDRDAQIISLNNQKTHYETLIAANDAWQFAGIYYDEGISGTRKDTRPELKRLIQDCLSGMIDLVITKSISRFARNTMDCLELVRLLTAHNVNIFFEKENLGTQDTGGELILSILASIAAEESRSISENEKWAIQKRFQKGTFRLSRAPYGYDLTDGFIRINPKEAEIVRFIFHSILNGQGTASIAAELNAQHVPTKRHGKWHAGTIQSMIHNVFFAGDLLMQKTWHDSHYHVQFNYGEFDQYYIENHHPAIVSREVFNAANQACTQRGREKNNHPLDDKRLRNDPHHNRYCFTGKIRCGLCGSTLKRQMIYRSDGCHAIWVCRSHLHDPMACPLKRILETDIMHAFVTMLNKLAFSKKVLLQPFIEQLLCSAPSQEIKRITSLQKKEPLDDQSGLIIAYSQGRIDPVTFHTKIARLKRKGEMVTDVSTKHLSNDLPARKRESWQLVSEAKDLGTFLSSWQIRKTAFNEDAFNRFIDSIRIDSRNQITFCLKCGLALSEQI